MNTVICYLTAMVMQFVGMKMAHDPDPVSSLPNPQCEEQTLDKQIAHPSEGTEDLSPIFFQKRKIDNGQKEQS